jgi:trans-aconitate 2-methyltransferase
MLARARTALPHVPFTLADLTSYAPPAGTSLLFANAVFHWLPAKDRIPTIVRLLRLQQPGGVLAFQVPNNYHEPSHRAMREAAAAPGPWRACFDAVPAGQGPALDPIEDEGAYYDALKPWCRQVDMWTTRYVHVLDGAGEVVEWVRGTGLQPFLRVVPEEGGVREGFLGEYKRRLEEGYPRREGGVVLLGYPRFFVVCYR